MLTHAKISESVKKVADNHNLSKASYFGSYADGCATEESDLDLLVEFAAPTVPLLRIIALKQSLQEELGIPVDIVHGPLPKPSTFVTGRTVLVYEH
jgi:predicted nucleotidyltransferase